MQPTPHPRVFLRWLFNVIGWVLLLGSDFVVRSVLRPDYWGRLLFGEDTAGYSYLWAGAYFYVGVAPLFCWAAAYGLKRDKRWAFPAGICACVMLAAGFPWLTPAGVFGFYALMAARRSQDTAQRPAGVAPAADPWISTRGSKAQTAVGVVCWLMAFVALGWFSVYARNTGMPEWKSGWTWFLWFSVFALFNTALHECGHCIVAWAVRYHVRTLSIGPFFFFRDHTGFRFRFDVRRLFESGGYLGAVPVSNENLRWNEIAVLAAGLFTNAVSCLVFLAVFFALPGTPFERWWWIAALNVVIAFAMGLSNAIPLGYCDGSMLFHLVLWTPAGRLLLERKLIVHMAEQADTCHGKAAFDREIELHQAMLERSPALGGNNTFMIAACYQELASAHAMVRDWPASEADHRKCLEFEDELAANPALAALAWTGLHDVLIRRGDAAGAAQAYARALAALDRHAAATSGVPDADILGLVLLAQTHERNGNYPAALIEVERGLKSIPRDARGVNWRGSLLRTQAVCRLGLSEVDGGLGAARAGAGCFCSPAIPPARRNLAWAELADFGEAMWRAGQADMAMAMLREAIPNLEAGEAAAVAAQNRIVLAGILRHVGRLSEAWAELPAEDGLSPRLLRDLLTERAELHLLAGNPALAVADCREVVNLWCAHPCAPAREIASAEALLSKALLAAGDLAEADELAERAASVLSPLQHPDAASCLISMALARGQSAGERAPVLSREGFRLIETAPLLAPPEKARLRATETARIRQFLAATAEEAAS